MRPVKFRAKVLPHEAMTNAANGWAEGFYFTDVAAGEVKHYITSAPMTWEVDPNTVGQFTDVEDKNGRDICEGDIVDAGNRLEGSYGVVVWNRYEARFVLDMQMAHNARRQHALWFELQRPRSHRYEIVGNRYDNPELLNKNYDNPEGW